MYFFNCLNTEEDRKKKFSYTSKAAVEAREQSAILPGSDIDAIVENELDDLRSYAQKFRLENPIFQRIITDLTTSVLADGVSIQADTGYPELNKILEEAWQNHFDDPDISGEKTGHELLTLALEETFTDGEVFFMRTSDKNTKNGLKYQLLNASDIDYPDGDAPDGIKESERFFKGIVTDKLTRTKKAYYVANGEEPGLGVTSWKRIDAKFIRHFGFPVAYKQTRYFTPFSSVFIILEHLKNIIDNEGEASDWNSRFFGALKTDFGGMRSQDSSVIRDIGDCVKEVPGGIFFDLAKGDEFSVIENLRPSSNFQKVLFTFAAVAGLPANMPANNIFTTYSDENYSSALAGREKIFEFVKRIRKYLTKKWVSPWYCDQVEWCRKFDPATKRFLKKRAVSLKRMCRHQAIYPQMPMLDRAKETKALMDERGGALSTRGEILMAMGKDPEAHRKKLIQEILDDFKAAEKASKTIKNQLTAREIFFMISGLIQGKTAQAEDVKSERDSKHGGQNVSNN